MLSPKQASEPEVDFFVSYTGRDSAWAEWIAWQLEAEGHHVTIQAWDFRPGENFILRMDEAAKNSKRTLAVLSPEYLESAFGSMEWAAAQRKRSLLLVRVKEVDVEGILGPETYIDLVGKDKTQARNVLLAGIRQGRAKPGSEPAFPNEARRSPEPGFPGSLPDICHIRRLRNPHLTGRDALRAQLRDRLVAQQGAVLTQAIAGLGGVGKTTLATDYAYQFAHTYQLVWELPCEDIGTAQVSLGELAVRLGLAENTLDPQTWERARNWLEHHPGWLLICDNAVSREQLAPVLPRGGSGHVLVTSRNPNWRGMGGEPLTLPPLSPEDGAAFLLRRGGRPEAEAAEARAVSEALGGLPLALELAAAYVEAAGISYGRYQAKMKGLEPVAQTWEISLAALPAGAVRLLERMAFLAPEAIPASLLEGWDGEDLDETLGALRRYSLLTRDADGSVFVHRLLQQVVRGRMADPAGVCGEVVRWVDERFVYDHEKIETWAPSEPLYEHAVAVALAAAERGVELERSGRLLNQAGILAWHKRGQLAAALPLLQRALAIYEKVYGLEHPEVATLANNIGHIMQAQGDLAGALEYTRRALAIDEKVYGPEHPNVARDINNIGLILKDRGDLAGALQYARRALAIDEKVHGPEHPSVARDANNIGQMLLAQGDLATAFQYARRALAIDEKVYGPEHPVVARDANNTGQILHAKGDLVGALEHTRRAEAIWTKFLGPDHPNVATLANNIGLILKDQGDFDAALQYARRALAIDEKVYGPEHPDVARDANNIGLILQAQGDLDAALVYTRRALAIFEKAYSPEHPHIATLANNIGQILQAQGDLAGALDYTRRALAIFEKAYSPDHPNAATLANNIGLILQAQGDLAGALEYGRRAIAIDEKVYGPEHPAVARDANNIGLILQAQGDFDAALPYARRAEAIFLKFLGPDHPNTRTATANRIAIEAAAGKS